MSDQANQNWKDSNARDRARQHNGHVYGGYNETNYHYYAPKDRPERPAAAEKPTGRVFSEVAYRNYLAKRTKLSTSEQMEKDQALLDAAKRGQQTRTEQMLFEGADPNYQKDGPTALHCASSEGYTDIVEMLVSRYNAEINVHDSSQSTPLDYAARNGHLEIVEVLLRHRALLHGSRRSLLAVACIGGKSRLPIVKKLLEAGAPILSRHPKWLIPDRIGYSYLFAPDEGPRTLINSTPLHIAAIHGNIELVRLLLESGAAVNDTCMLHYWPIPEPFRMTHKVTPLHLTHDLECVMELLQYGAEVNFHDSNGCTPVMYAVWRQKPDVLQLLLDESADASITEHESGETMLAIARKYGQDNRGKWIDVELKKCYEIIESHSLKTKGPSH